MVGGEGEFMNCVNCVYNLTYTMTTEQYELEYIIDKIYDEIDFVVNLYTFVSEFN